MKSLVTKVEFHEADRHISYAAPLMFMGSCFSDHMATKLKAAAIPVWKDPFGISFNPLSMASNLLFLLGTDLIKREDFIENQGLYGHFRFHTSFSHPDVNQALKKMNDSLIEARRLLPHLSHLYVTLGTAWVFRKEDEVVNNCHKLPASQFQRSIANVDQISRLWKESVHQLRSVNPEIQVVFTLSPVRHWKDGAEGNSLSKSTLRLAIEQSILSDKKCVYLPSYEFMMDECRDYRFYADDMLHPSNMAIEMIWERFRESQVDPSAYPWMDEHEKILKRKAHRSLFPGSDNDERFKAETVEMEHEWTQKTNDLHWK